MRRWPTVACPTHKSARLFRLCWLKKPGQDAANMANYRPVSNLTFVSKVTERAVASQLNEYLVANDLLPHYQSAYRKRHSTETAMLLLYVIAYKNFRNRLNKLIRIAEKSYYAEKFEAYKSNSKQTWQTIRQILNKNDRIPVTDSFRNGNDEITDKYAIVGKFNEYFVNIGPTLANKIPTLPDSCMKYLTGTYKNSFFLQPTTPDEIIDVVKAMQPKKSAGYDNISTETIKLVIPHIAAPLSKIISPSLLDQYLMN